MKNLVPKIEEEQGEEESNGAQRGKQQGEKDNNIAKRIIVMQHEKENNSVA